ncbi:uncharacterized protein LOC113332877 [Papaver somniferum]|uniref:uncharacterized protein LOC113332877 n=1 Tax=Papaver somniferum TaxID=3469 RepID=UPI000E6FB81A|nr:uncharacterized protein LOC113332877 [Papaver somniferum]
MSVYKSPKSVIKECEKIIRNFSWSGDPAVKKLVTVKWDENKDLKVHQLIVNGRWKVPEHMYRFFDKSELLVLAHGKDIQIWETDLQGKFSVSSAAQLIRKKYPITRWEINVWDPCIHPYTSTNLWKILRGACATEETVRKKGFLTVSNCYLCGNNQDTMEHILWQCDFSVQIWHWLGGLFQCLNPMSFQEVLQVAKEKSGAIKAIWFNCAFNTMT